jgi:hypothetical protein
MVLSRPPNRQTSRAIVAVARVGYVVHGLVELLLGSLAVMAAVHFGGRVTNNQGAIRTLGDRPWGDVLLIAVGVGLAAYACWQLARAIWDPDHRGEPDNRGLKSIARRIGYTLTAFGQAVLSITSFQLALGNGGGGSADEARTWVGNLVQHDAGQLLIGAIGIGVVAFGIAQIHKGLTKRFAKHLESRWGDGGDRRWAIQLGRVGYTARGVVFGIVGLGLIQAARHASSSEMRDVGGALRELGAQPYGTYLMVLVAAGLAIHGLFMILSAGVRRIHA